MGPTVRNVLIILALAAVLAFAPGGGRGGAVVSEALSIAFLGALAWFAGILYRQYKSEIFGLGDRMRALLYVSLGTVVLLIAAAPRMWNSGPGTLAWFLLAGVAAFGFVTVWRHWREYA